MSLVPDLGFNNLFRIDVGKGQRMTYTIRIEGVNLDVDIIEFFSIHKEYEKRFHY
jgi:hypothetical protein